MKRAISMLGAVAAIAAGFLFAAPAANAAINCTAVHVPAGGLPTATWPDGDWTQRCVNTSFPTVPTAANGTLMYQAAQAANNAAADELERSPNRNFTNKNGVRYFLFRNSADYVSWAATAGFGPAVPHAATDFGVTKFNDSNVPVYSAIFETNDLGEAAIIRRATGTQMGVAINALQGYVKNGGIVPAIRFRFSDTIASPANAWQNIYKQNLDKDWANLTQHPCRVGSARGLFGKYADNRLPVTASTYICTDDSSSSQFGDGTTLSPTYANLPACVGVPPGTGNAACNKAILIQAWPEVYNSIHTIFAQEFAFPIGNDQVSFGRTADVYLNGNFTCSKMLIRIVGPQGRLPVASDLTSVENAAGCILPTMTTKCKKLFNAHNGRFPDGNVFNCMPAVPVNTTALQSQQQFEKLGGTGGTTPTPAKDKLDLVKADVYFFPDHASYSAAFTAANEQFGSLINVCGATGPDGATNVRIWRSVMNHSCTTASTSIKQTYVALHELGHVIDLTHALGQRSSTAVFDLALQIDLYRLNYVSWTSTSVNTKRLPCGTGAPLAGLVDSVGVAFCNGAALSSKYSALTGDIITNVLKFDRLDEMSYQTSATVVGPPGQTIPVAPGWREFFPQGFAVRAAKAPMSATSNMPYLESLLQQLSAAPDGAAAGHGWFACTLGPRQATTPPPKGYMQLILENPDADIQFANLGPKCQFSELPQGWVNLR